MKFKNRFSYNSLNNMWKWFKKSTSQEVPEEELKKNGFDPTQIPVQEQSQKKVSAIKYDKDYVGYISPTYQEAIEIINSFKFPENDGDPRHQLGHSKGGKMCGQKQYVSKIRSTAKQMIKLFGKKMLSGDFNLTRISFPIKTMVPKTALENCTFGCSTFPYYMKLASESKDPVQRMKFALTAIISAFYYMNLFLKPLNPLIGQTLEASYSDGTKIYCQQVSHHPPISYFLFIGPNDQWRYSGYYLFEATAGLNSLTLNNKGKRTLQFRDGGKITAGFAKEVYCGAFLGDLRSESVGGFQLIDEQNKLNCRVDFGKVKKKPSDYIQGTINKEGKPICKYYGAFCGYLNIDETRYWDGRYMQPFKIILKDQQKCLPSDFRLREDLQQLKAENMDAAQQAKQRIQQHQRRDVRLRVQYKKKYG